ncbi:MAG TPA: DUF6448 family protein [Steroidobacteraceae bacterium]|nr:DUF6448 family protein [Steroidobacteraceae bacterium]
MNSVRIGRLLLAAILMLPLPAWTHCDSLDGPVVRDARAALAAGDIMPVLKWVRADREQETVATFRQAMAVRRLNDDARDLADRHFFETLVRIHRAGEGEPFTGLKPAGEIEPGIAAADAALAAGSSDELVADLAAAMTDGIRRRFSLALERRKETDESIEAGREYVEAYVDYVHFVENLHRLITEGASHAHHEPTP